MATRADEAHHKKGGITGWGKLLYTTSTNPTYNVLNAGYRFHVCYNDPCDCRWEPSKYGTTPEPTHVRIVPKRLPSAVAELPSSAAASSGAAPNADAVADSSSSAVASSTTLPEDAVVADASSSAAASSGTVPKEAAAAETVPEDATPEEEVLMEVHTPPKGVPLPALAPPVPAAPLSCSSVACDVDAVASPPDIEPAVAARSRIEAGLLKLARDIRAPNKYVGYAAFILMGLLKKCRPRVYEGATHIDLLEVFAPWATSHCTTELEVAAVPCALKPTESGPAELMPICEEYPLASTRHFVAAVAVEATDASVDAKLFETMYAQMGVGIIPTLLDGDCAFDVQTMQLGIDSTVESRNALRIELSDYLLHRIGEPWMHDIMASCQEIDWDDVHVLRAGATHVPLEPIASPPAVAAAVADSPEVAEVARPDEETVEAMRWASTIKDYSSVLALIEALPKKLVEEQVMLYRKRDQAMVATQIQPPPKIRIGEGSRYAQRMAVAERFHTYLTEECIDISKRLPYGEMLKFIQKHVHWTSKGRPLETKRIQEWYSTWRKSQQVVSAVARPGEGESLVQARQPHRSRTDSHVLPRVVRQRGPGGGRKFKVPCVREGACFFYLEGRHASHPPGPHPRTPPPDGDGDRISPDAQIQPNIRDF